ncbi:MAG: sulfatase-like hydrolase/transferase [Firmicutes bacterium]|nr:sulfatase-like hydrolase/transferase [Bacillota bacterium]
MTRPNIIFFFSDQQRWDTLGCYGQKMPVTPNLDKIAEGGTRFEYAFTCQPVCGPARACIQTGLFATETGCYRNGIALSPTANTIAKRLNSAGYETAYVGKWHLASTKRVTNYREIAIPEELRGGYKDYWMAADLLEFTSDSQGGYVFDIDGRKVEFGGYRADRITDFALDYIRNQDGEKPFFLFLSHIEPHHQNNAGHYQGPEGSRERWGGFDVPLDLVGTQGDWREEFADYLGCCNSLDENVGRVISLLEEKGILDNTIFIYTSDHGSHFKTRNGEYKRSCHESSIRIPMIITGGEFTGKGVQSNFASLIDIPKTILRCAGIEADDMQGRPLHEALDNAEDWENEAFIQISESQTGRAIRTADWKYAVSDKRPGYDDSGDSDVYTEECLFDLNNDYAEKNNLVFLPEYREIKEMLRHKLLGKMALARENPCKILET